MLQLNYNLKNKQFKLRMAWACEMKVSWAVTTRPMGNVLTEFLWRWILFLPSSCPFFISPDFQQTLSLFRMTKMNMSAFIANHCPAKMEFWKDVLPASLVITSNSFFLVCFMTSPFSVPQIISLCDWRFVFFKNWIFFICYYEFHKYRMEKSFCFKYQEIYSTKERRRCKKKARRWKPYISERISSNGLNYQKQ